MRPSCTLWLLALLGCAPSPAEPEGPPPPRLVDPLTYVQADFSDASGGILEVEGRLELTVQPGGEAEAVIRRPLLSAILRKGRVPEGTLTALARRTEEWNSGTEASPEPPGSVWATLTYGAKKSRWSRATDLPPTLRRLSMMLVDIAHSLPEVRTR